MDKTRAEVLKFEGWVTSGLGRGAQFLDLDWVRRELRHKLSLVPFPGTLNLRVPPEVRDAIFARRESFVVLSDPASPDCPGFVKDVILRANGRTCASGYLILPEKTIHPDTLEIISAYNLRERLCLFDGDRVEVEAYPD